MGQQVKKPRKSRKPQGNQKVKVYGQTILINDKNLKEVISTLTLLDKKYS